MEPDSPTMEKPTIDVKSRGNRKLEEKRRKEWKKHMKAVLYISKTEKQRASYVLDKWRRKQRHLLDKKDIEDPDPFAKTYVFYCLDI